MRFNSLIPELSVYDVKKSLHYYADVLGFKIEYFREESGFYFLSLGKAQLMIERANGKWKTSPLRHPYGRGINFQIEVRSVSGIAASLRKENWHVKIPAHDNWYRRNGELLGCRELLVEDPDGYLLRFSEDIGRRKAARK